MVTEINLGILIFVSLSGSLLVQSQHIHGGFTVNGNQYSLRWDVNGHFITFRATARGTGFVGFGLSPKGTMEESDLFIAGMHNNGTVYAMVNSKILLLT
jgi:hypothetical protein